ncbi:boron transporter 2 [Pyrus ussuriensis x Pyrus communis]|uniref:Boron transporter 2 n=1 Tax=Pyrus ussuriensis x Pyrus communis TaxID=2448454 RepID=A0A5N5I3C2_9ROSA|nr:boron transporter 2 [Pyrus ussuriensis x Pyrus communis]
MPGAAVNQVWTRENTAALMGLKELKEYTVQLASSAGYIDAPVDETVFDVDKDIDNLLPIEVKEQRLSNLLQSLMAYGLLAYVFWLNMDPDCCGAFPLLNMLLVLVRQYFLPKFFKRAHLQDLDAAECEEALSITFNLPLEFKSQVLRFIQKVTLLRLMAEAGFQWVQALGCEFVIEEILPVGYCARPSEFMTIETRSVKKKTIMGKSTTDLPVQGLGQDLPQAQNLIIVALPEATRLAFAWYINLSPNAIQRMEMSVSSLARMAQASDESPMEYLTRFKSTKNWCRVPLPEVEFVRIALNGLNVEYKKKFLGNPTVSYALAESENPQYVIVDAAEIMIDKPYVCKALAQVSPKDAKTRSVAEEMTKIIKFRPGHNIPKAKELKGKTYCKYHNSNKHATNNCVVFQDAIQNWIEKSKLKFQEKQMAVDVNPFPSTTIGMVDAHLCKNKGKGKTEYVPVQHFRK